MGSHCLETNGAAQLVMQLFAAVLAAIAQKVLIGEAVGRSSRIVQPARSQKRLHRRQPQQLELEAAALVIELALLLLLLLQFRA